jgi:D-serine deaminase-like pyridoxal phosphate-dependent protein
LGGGLQAATADLEPPFAAVDLEAFDANAADLLRRAGGTPVRLASKSVRCRALAARAAAAGLRGVLAFTLPEALWLAEAGEEDVVVAYPTVTVTRSRAGPAASARSAAPSTVG